MSTGPFLIILVLYKRLSRFWYIHIIQTKIGKLADEILIDKIIKIILSGDYTCCILLLVRNCYRLNCWAEFRRRIICHKAFAVQ